MYSSRPRVASLEKVQLVVVLDLEVEVQVRKEVNLGRKSPLKSQRSQEKVQQKVKRQNREW